MYVIKRLTNETAINIGRQGENIATVIEFPLDEYIENYGAGTAQLVHIRPGDTAPYLCTTEQLDTALDWIITNEDTAYAGTGMCELRWIVDDTLAKSMVYKTVINPSITADSVLPDQYQSWYDAMMEAIEQKIIPIDDLKNNPVLNLIDTGLNAFGARIMPGEDLNWEKYLKPGSWIGAPDSQDPVKNKPDMGSGHYYRLIVKGLYDSGYSDVTPQYLIRIIEVEQGSKSETWTQVVRTYGFDDPEYMRIYPWVKLATSSDLDAITTAVTANTAGRIGMLSNVNLDDLHTDNTCGVYWLNNYSSDITGTKPVAEGQGLLIVKKQNSTTYRQTYIAVTGNTSPYFAVRSYSSSSWGEWQSASLQTILNTTYALGYSGMGRIQQNDDLNSYTTPGSYVATSTGITSTLSNCPITNSGFSLHVESVAGGTGQFIVQTIKRVSDGADIYTRTYSGSVWTGWKSSSAAPKQLSGITSLSDIPLGSNGYAQFDASVSPTGATAYFTYWCTGTDDRRSIIAVYTADSVAKAYVNVLHNADGVTWKGWKSITLS